jgi:isopentenyl-diphosphate delta-isomerase
MGTAGILAAHRGSGLLHRAFSVFVFGEGGAALLLQQRSRSKQLFRLRWANTCCSHPLPGDEPLPRAAERRLREEFGFAVALKEAGAFVYRAEDPDNDMSEYEHDTVLFGMANGAISIDPDPGEIADWRWVAVADLERDLSRGTDEYAPWLPESLRLALAALRAGA